VGPGQIARERNVRAARRDRSRTGPDRAGEIAESVDSKEDGPIYALVYGRCMYDHVTIAIDIRSSSVATI